MNARWLKQNLGSILFGVGFFVILGLLIWRLTAARHDQKETEANLQAQKDRLTDLEGRNPSPNKENIQAAGDDAQRLQEFLKTVHKEIREGFNVPAGAEIRTDIEFAEQMPKRLKALDYLTRQAGVQLPDGFKFGFDRYATTLPCRNPPASGEECGRILALLSKQLLVIERLTALMVSNGVDEVVSIRRSDAELNAGGAVDSALPISRDERAHCLITPFELQFTCNAQALQSFLNNLTRDPWLFAVRHLKVDARSGATDSATPQGGGSSRLVVTTRVDLLEFQHPKPKTDHPVRGKPPTS